MLLGDYQLVTDPGDNTGLVWFFSELQEEI